MATSFCAQCGTHLPEGAHFCVSCGAHVPDVGEAAEPPPATEPAAPAAPTAPAAPPASAAGPPAPPSGPPSPPSGPPVPPPTPPASGGAPGDKRRLMIVGAVIAAVVLIVGGILVFGGGDKEDEGTQLASGEIFLEPAESNGNDPFTPSVDTNTAPPPVILQTSATTPGTTTLAPTTTMAGSTVAGSTTTGVATTTTSTSTSLPTTITTLAPGTTPVRVVDAAAPGLYGGTMNNAACDQEQMVSYLTDNPDKQAAWASVQGIAPADVPAYIMSLTPVVLRADTRVTNHGYVNGRVTENQSVLQAGTAVLVDEYGIPRARCYCGNPLTPPIPQPAGTTVTGTPWPGYNPTSVVVIQNVNNTVINNFTIVNLTNYTYFGRTPPKSSPTGTTTDGPVYVDYFCDMYPTAPECLPPTTTAAPTTTTTEPGPVLGTGDIQFTLRWSGTADVDLAVIDPNGEEINYGQPSSSSGGTLDVDSNAGCYSVAPHPVENVFWPTGQSLVGEYTVAVTLYADCGAALPQAYTLRALIDGVPVELTPVQQGIRQEVNGSLATVGERQVFKVTKGAAPPPTTAPPATEVPATTAPTVTPGATPTSITLPPEQPNTTVRPPDPENPPTLEQWCTGLWIPPEEPVLGPQNPNYTLCMHDPIYSAA